MEELPAATDFAAFRATHRPTGRLRRHLEGTSAPHVDPRLRLSMLEAALGAALQMDDEWPEPFATFLDRCEHALRCPGDCDADVPDIGRPDLAALVRPAMSYLLDPTEPEAFVRRAAEMDTSVRTGTLCMDLTERCSLFFFWEEGAYRVMSAQID